MPVLENAKKALRASKRKAVYNRSVRSRVKTSMDAMVANPTSDNLTEVYSAIDKAVNRNIFHKNKAARLKSQMNGLLAK